MEFLEYLTNIPLEKHATFKKLEQIIGENIPLGFEKGIAYKLPTWQVPLSVYPKGYHCAKNQALPFISLAAQKKHFAIYHMGIYANIDLLLWFSEEYAKTNFKLNMGKSCIKFTHEDKIPYELIAQLCQKTTMDEWIKLYEKTFLK